MRTIEDIKELVRRKNSRSDGWFFPSDIIPHSAKFKYACKKYHHLGKLERFGNSKDRWGYMYRFI